MAVGFRNSAGVDFDSLFDPFVEGTPPANTGFRASTGVDLAGRYAPIAFGTKGPDVGFRTSGGVDLSNLWAAFGTAVYAVLGVPSPLIDSEFGAPGAPTTATAGAEWQRDGDTAYFPTAPGAGEWYPGGGATVGDAYDIRFTQTASSGGGTFTGTLATWMQLNATRAFSLSVTRSTLGVSQATRTILVEIRRRSDLVVVVSGSVALDCTAETGG